MPINNSVKLCGAKARRNKHKPCTQPAMKNGRCRMHGGKSTGAKTHEGKARRDSAPYKHGLYSQDAILERKMMRAMLKQEEGLGV